jgi:hypothetical protein
MKYILAIVLLCGVALAEPEAAAGVMPKKVCLACQCDPDTFFYFGQKVGNCQR